MIFNIWCLVLSCFWAAASACWAQKPLKLLFAGDVMAHMPQIESARVADGYDFRASFRAVQPIIKRADYAVANLELTLRDRPPYSGFPLFRAPDQLAVALRDSGFDMLVTANNHANDGGLYGLLHTLDVLDQLGLQHTGTFRSLSEREAMYPILVFVAGYKLCFVNYTYGINQRKTPAPAYVNLIDRDLIQRDLARARLFNPDFIIAIMHWGREYELMENLEQRQVGRLLLEEGADLVIGMHPHVVQPVRYETVQRADGSTFTGLVAYSLGNFISSQTKPHTEGGLLLEVDLEKGKTGRLELAAFRGLPVCRIIAHEQGKPPAFYVVPCSGDSRLAPGATASQLQAMQEFGAELYKRLGL